MGTRAHEGVEFLDLVERAPGSASDLLDDPEPAVGGSGRRWPALAFTLLAGIATLVAARVVGAPEPPPPAVAAPAPVYSGEVALPRGFGVPVQIATATAQSTDVVWVLGSLGQVVRVADGRVTTASAAHGYDALAVRPDGRTVYVSTGRLAPTVVGLDPTWLEPRTDVALAAAPVTALAAGVGSVWAASSAGVEGWTSDLTRPMRTMRMPPEVTRVRSIAIVGARLQALVTTTPGASALLRLEPPGGGPTLTSQFTGPVSLVPGIPALVAHVGLGGSVVVAADPADPGDETTARPLPTNASIWPTVGVGTTAWVASTAGSASLDCFDATGDLVGRMAVGDTGRGVVGPVVTTARAVYAATAGGALARGGHGSCGIDPHAWPDRPRGD